MKRLQSHWPTVVVASLVVVLGGTVVWRAAGNRAAQAVQLPSYAPLSHVQHDAIITLMQDIALDREALIALNPSGEQAESILSTIRTWQSTNQTTLAARKHTIGQKITAVHRLEEAIRMGPPQAGRDSELEIARGELAEAKAAYVSALGSLKTSIGELLSQSQKSTWAAIQAGHGRTMPIRMLSLSDAQRLALGKAQQRYERQRAAASTAEELNSAAAAWERELDGILTSEQKNVIASFNSFYSAASQNVAEAFSEVLATAEG